MMKSIRFFLYGVLGVIGLQTAAPAAVQFQNVQVYRWAYAEHNGVATDGYSTWCGYTYDQSRDGNTPSRWMNTQVSNGTATTLPTTGSVYGKLEPTAPGYSAEGITSTSTRFTVNETLNARLSGMIQARIGHYGSLSERMSGTQWTRARLVDFVTGATIISRIVRTDLQPYGLHYAWDLRNIDQTVSLAPGRYNLILDSYFEAFGPESVNPQYPTSGYAGFDFADGGSNTWDLNLELSRPSLPAKSKLSVIPEPASAAVAVLLGAALLRRRGG